MNGRVAYITDKYAVVGLNLSTLVKVLIASVMR